MILSPAMRMPSVLTPLAAMTASVGKVTVVTKLSGMEIALSTVQVQYASSYTAFTSTSVLILGLQVKNLQKF